MKNLFDINDKVIVMTGATGVLGSSIAEYLASQGAKIVILGRNLENGNNIVKKIINNGDEAIFLQSDVLDEKILETNREDIISKYGTIDILINAAGGNIPGATITPEKTIFDINANDFKSVVDLNLIGTVLPTQVFLKPMVDKKSGVVVNFSSVSSFHPLTRVAGYSAAKSAINNFTEFMAIETAKKFGSHIRINAIAPGFFLAEQNRSLLTNPDGSLTERGDSIIKQTPFARFGEPEDLFGTIHYLISDASKFVTGTVAVVDGWFTTYIL